MIFRQPNYSTPSARYFEALEQRRFQRVALALPGRYMLESRKEYPCQTVSMSPGDMVLTGEVAPGVGEKVVVYLDALGRFAGTASHMTSLGFSMTFELPPAKRHRLADRLTWFANRAELDLGDDREYERVIPFLQRAILHMPDGREHLVKILNLSASGVALESSFQPDLGAAVLVGSTPATVVRHFDGGFAGKFPKPFAAGEIDETTRL
jgi:hypothetical protein